jgi:hypothetical protein
MCVDDGVREPTKPDLLRPGTGIVQPRADRGTSQVEVAVQDGWAHETLPSIATRSRSIANPLALRNGSPYAGELPADVGAEQHDFTLSGEPVGQPEAAAASAAAGV